MKKVFSLLDYCILHSELSLISNSGGLADSFESQKTGRTIANLFLINLIENHNYMKSCILIG